MRVLIIGNDGGTNIGGSLQRAAARLGFGVLLLPSRRAMDAPWIVRQVSWRLRGRRPPRLRRFSGLVQETLDSFQPDVLLTTGLAPVLADVLKEAVRRGIQTANYLTDDPFGPAHRAQWFLDALPCYQLVASPRRANLDELRGLGCPTVTYLPFGYDPELHYPVPPRPEMLCDVLFVGGYEAERAPFVRGLVESGLDVRILGDWRWKSQGTLAKAYYGHAEPDELRAATCSARINVVMGRRQNRDGHTMRTFEVLACGAPSLLEDTSEHRELLADVLTSDSFFSDPRDLEQKARRILDHLGQAAEIADSARRWLIRGGHRYDDRLVELLATHDRSSAR